MVLFVPIFPQEFQNVSVTDVVLQLYIFLLTKKKKKWVYEIPYQGGQEEPCEHELFYRYMCMKCVFPSCCVKIEIRSE